MRQFEIKKSNGLKKCTMLRGGSVVDQRNADIFSVTKGVHPEPKFGLRQIGSDRPERKKSGSRAVPIRTPKSGSHITSKNNPWDPVFRCLGLNPDSDHPTIRRNRIQAFFLEEPGSDCIMIRVSNPLVCGQPRTIIASIKLIFGTHVDDHYRSEHIKVVIGHGSQDLSASRSLQALVYSFTRSQRIKVIIVHGLFIHKI